MSISIETAAAQAMAERQAAMKFYEAIADWRTLQALRDSDDPVAGSSKVLELVILERKRLAKGDLEALEKVADLFDKASLPLAAAFPVFMSALAGEKLLVDALRAKLVIGAYIIGGIFWIVLRALSLLYALRARRGLAELGKVD